MTKPAHSTLARLTLFGPLPLPYGGVAIHVSRLYGLLRERGFDVQLAALGWPGVETETLHRLPDQRWLRPISLARLARIAERGGVVHNHTAFAAYPTRLSLGLLLSTCRLAGLRRIETLHSQSILERYPALPAHERRMFLEAMTTAERVIAIGGPLREFLLGLGVPDSRIVVGSPLLPADEAPGELEQQHGAFFAAHSPIWVTIGAMVPLYDFATIAEAFVRYREQEANAGLVVISAGFVHDGVYERRLRSLIADVAGDVVILTDVPANEVAAMLRRASIVIRGPRSESFGLSRAEGAMAGVPVVATNTGITDFMTLYSHGDPRSLADAVQRALRTTPETRAEAAAFYTNLAATNVGAVLSVYDELGIRGA